MKKAMKRRAVFAGLVAFGATVSMAGGPLGFRVVEAAQAESRNTHKHSINLAGAQRMLSQRMSKEVLLIAHGYNPRENLRNLRTSHARFAKVLAGLRHGDLELALVPAEDAAIVQRLEKVELLWPSYEEVLSEIESNGQVTAEHVGRVAELSLPILGAMNEAVSAFETEANKGKLHSVLAIAVNQSGKLRMLSQKMTKEFLLIAYNHQPAANRAALKNTMATFEQILAGLMKGDADLKLLPAPSAEIMSQLKTVDQVYLETKAILALAVSGQKLNQDHLADLASLNLTLLAEADRAVTKYVSF